MSDEQHEVVIKVPVGAAYAELRKEVGEQGKVLALIKQQIEDWDHKLFGNGQPGLLDQHDKRLDGLEQKESRQSGFWSYSLQLLIGLGVVVDIFLRLRHP